MKPGSVRLRKGRLGSVEVCDEVYGGFDVGEDSALGGFFGVDDGAVGVDDEEGSDGHAALIVEDAVGAADFTMGPEVGED